MGRVEVEVEVVDGVGWWVPDTLQVQGSVTYERNLFTEMGQLLSEMRQRKQLQFKKSDGLEFTCEMCFMFLDLSFKYIIVFLVLNFLYQQIPVGSEFIKTNKKLQNPI